MSKPFEKYVMTIVENIDCSTNIKSELSEELMNHLEESYESLKSDGYSEEAAKKEALRRFGHAEEISNDISQAMFPYQRALLLTLAVSSFIYSFLVYIIQLFNEGDAHIYWLIMSVSMSIILSLFVFHIVKRDGKLLLNSALILHLIVYFFGLGLALGTDHFLTAMLAVYAILIILLSLTLIYLNVIFHWEMSRLKKGFHLFNMTVGIFIVSVNVYIIGIFLIFGELSIKLLLLLIPTVVWVICYIVQIIFLNKKFVKVSTAIAMIPTLFVISVLLFFVWTYIV